MEKSRNTSLYFSLRTDNNLCNRQEFVQIEIVPESVSANLYQDFDASNDSIQLSSNSSQVSQVFDLNILDDDLIEPFEFFVLRIKVLESTIPSNSLTIPELIYVYIQDDDCMFLINSFLKC